MAFKRFPSVAACIAVMGLIPGDLHAKDTKPHDLAPHVERLRTDVLYLTELADLQARLIETARQDAGAVSAEGRRGTSLCTNSPITRICSRLTSTIGSENDD